MISPTWGGVYNAHYYQPGNTIFLGRLVSSGDSAERAHHQRRAHGVAACALPALHFGGHGGCGNAVVLPYLLPHADEPRANAQARRGLRSSRTCDLQG